MDAVTAIKSLALAVLIPAVIVPLAMRSGRLNGKLMRDLGTDLKAGHARGIGVILFVLAIFVLNEVTR